MTNPYLVTIRATTGPHAGRTLTCDLYDILASIGMTNVAQIQAAKKILRGGRADKDWATDMAEGIDSLRRAVEIEGVATPTATRCACERQPGDYGPLCGYCEADRLNNERRANQ